MLATISDDMTAKAGLAPALRKVISIASKHSTTA